MIGAVTAVRQTLALDFVQGGAPRVARCWSRENRAMNRATMARFSNQATTPRPLICRLVATEPEVHARVRGGTLRARHCASAACTIDHQVTLIEKLSTGESRQSPAKLAGSSTEALVAMNPASIPPIWRDSLLPAIRHTESGESPALNEGAQRTHSPVDLAVRDASPIGEGSLLPQAGGAA